MSMEATRKTTESLVEEVRNTYVSAEFDFCVEVEKEADLQVAIMDANEELSQRDYPCWITKVAENIDGSYTFKCNIEEEKDEE